MFRPLAISISLGLVLMTGCTPPSPPTSPLMTTTADGVTIYGEPYFGNVDASAPLILLFHQGGSNGRAEYAPLVAWLNEAGYRAIAWDQRAGGDTYGSSNRTVAMMDTTKAAGYCDAYADLEAALDYVIEQALAEEAIVWGSSYSGALVVQLAAKHPDRVAGVLAFSPASGGPLVDCRARDWLEQVDAPVAVLRPASEMERTSSVEQRALLEAHGVSFHVVEHGVHGSSMLVDTRTEQDMQAARAWVLDWLAEFVR